MNQQTFDLMIGKLTFEIASATENDSEVIVKLLSELYLELGEEKESIAFLSGEFIRFIINTEVTKIYLVREEHQYIGIFTLTESQAIYAGGKYGIIDEMYISPDFRQKKIGEDILKYIFQIALKNNWKRVDVTAPTDEKWIRTRKFYEKNGFVFTGPKYKFKL